MSMLLAVVVVIILTIWWNIRQIVMFTRLAYNAYHPLRKIPGPRNLPLIGAVYQFKLDSVEFLKQMESWFMYFMEKDPNRMGMFKMWLGPLPVAAVVWPDYVREILENNNLLKKSTNYDIVKQWIGDGLLISSGEKWQKRRKMITPAFHFTVLKEYNEIFRQQAIKLMELLEEKADTDREVDIFPYIKRCALDIICESAMGTRLDSQTGGNMNYVDAVTRISDLMWSHERLPWFWLRPVWYASGHGFEFDRLVKLTNDFTRNVIAQRRATLEEEGMLEEGVSMTEAEIKRRKPCFLDLLLMMQRANALTDEDIRAEVDTFMFEGHDTTACSTGFTIWLLGQFPKYQEQLHEEIDGVFGDSDRQPTEEDLKKLEYLDRCIKESLRLAPTVPIIARQLTQPITVAGITLPTDLTLALSPFATHRDIKHWTHAHDFYPDHFLPEAVTARHPYAYFPFSAGPRNCIGQKFAMAEEKTLLSWFFRRYRVVSVEPFPGNPIVPEIILKPVNGFPVRLYTRR